MFLEKKSGIRFFNIFHSSGQLVIYITQSNIYVCKMQNVGSLSTPVKLEKNMLMFNKNKKIVSYNGRKYKYCRKDKTGSYSDYKSFLAAVMNRGNV